MNRLWILLPLATALILPACGDDVSPTSPSSSTPPSNPSTGAASGPVQTGPGAPTILSPEPGANLSTLQPILTVTNATFGDGPRTYAFELAEAETGFGQLVDSEAGVPEGQDGTTSWQVMTPLVAGTEYIWRVQATGGGQTFSTDVVGFLVRDGFVLDHPDEVALFDPLTNGTSVAMEVVGGQFTPQGWQALSPSDYIRYQVPTMDDGYVEFDVTNIREPNPVAGKRMLISFWDPTKGNYRENPFRVHLQKMDRNTVTFDDVRLRWICRGQETNVGISFFDFEADVVYPWRIEWGSWRGVPAQQVRVHLEGIKILERNYDRPYHPKVFWIELGNQERAETLEEAIWSDVRIGSRGEK